MAVLIVRIRMETVLWDLVINGDSAFQLPFHLWQTAVPIYDRMSIVGVRNLSETRSQSSDARVEAATPSL